MTELAQLCKVYSPRDIVNMNKKPEAVKALVRKMEEIRDASR